MEALSVIGAVGAAIALLASFFNRRIIGKLQGRYKALNAEIGELRAWRKKIEDGHAKEIKRVSDLQEKLSQLGRKKVRRRSPATGRFESVFEDELTDE